MGLGVGVAPLPHAVIAMPQPAAWLSRLIAETGEMQLGTGILVLPLLHPVEVAETYGPIDALSNGRLVLGVGLGYRAEEFAAFGVERATGWCGSSLTWPC